MKAFMKAFICGYLVLDSFLSIVDVPVWLELIVIMPFFVQLILASFILTFFIGLFYWLS